MDFRGIGFEVAIWIDLAQDWGPVNTEMNFRVS